jgi:hypothetical protein
MSKQEEGYTVTETLTAVSILSLVGMIIFSILPSSSKKIEEIKKTLDFTIELLLADGILRFNAERIRIPYWEEKVVLIEDNTSIQIPWYYGNSQHYIRLFWDDHSLGLETENGIKKLTWFFLESPELEQISVSALSDEKGIPYGLDLAYTYIKEEYHFKISFGSRPVQREQP